MAKRYVRNLWDMDRIQSASICYLEELKTARLEELARSRPRKGWIAAIQDRIIRLQARFNKLSEVEVTKLTGAVVPGAAMEYLDHAEDFLWLNPGHKSAEQITQADAWNRLRTLSPATRVRIYSLPKTGHLYIGDTGEKFDFRRRTESTYQSFVKWAQNLTSAQIAWEMENG